MRPPLILLFSWLVLASNSARADESYYLYLPPIMGSKSTPGYPGVIPITSFSVGVNDMGEIDDLHVDKPIDSASPAIYAADVSGTHFPAADVLVYRAGASEPYLDFQMTAAFFSSYTPISNEGQEAFTLNFASGAYVPVVPEPSTSALLMLGLSAAAILAANAKRQRVEDPVNVRRAMTRT